MGSPSDGNSDGGRNAPADFEGEKRNNQTHRSTTDPYAKLYCTRPGMKAKRSFIGHGLMENRSGLLSMPGSPMSPATPNGWPRST